MPEQHIYLNIETGEWGDCSNLAIFTLTDEDVIRFSALSPEQRIASAKGATRYFGDTRGEHVRKHLSGKDLNIERTPFPPPVQQVASDAQ